MTPSGDSSRATVCPHGSRRAPCSNSTPLAASSAAAAATASASRTSNSTLAWGTGRPAGHSGVPKQAVAAWLSGQTPKCLLPAMSSLCSYSSPGAWSSGSPRASTYSWWLAGGSGVMTAKLAMNSICMAPILLGPEILVLYEPAKVVGAPCHAGGVLAALPPGEVIAPAGPTLRRRPRRPELAGVVSAVWATVVPTGVTALRVLPDAAVDLVLAGEHLAVAGPDTRPCIERLQPGLVIGLQLRPGAVPAVLGAPATAVRDERVPLGELWGGPGRRLAEELAATPDPEEAVERLEQACAERMAQGPLRPELDGLRRLVAPGRRLDLRELGTSERQLRRACAAAYGYGPRTLRRIVRFQAVLELLGRPRPPTLSDVAHRTGHVDQAHLNREVGAFSGLTPAGLRAALGRPA